jgi:hypothetical protein
VSSYGKVVILVALAACHHPVSARERALGLLPSEATIVAAADGPALAAWRRVVDVARPYAPAGFGCVIDAALGSEAVALAQREAGTTVVIVSRVSPSACPALARIAPDTYVATLGDATVERGLGPRWARARPYLASAPIAFAADLGTRHVLAAAERTAAWVAIDAADADDLAPRVHARAARYHALTVTRTGSQVLVRGDHLAPDQLATIADELLAGLDAPEQELVAPLQCPPVGGVIVSCSGNKVVVGSLADALAQLAAPAREPVVSGGQVIGLRLTADALMLRRGDVLLGIDAHQVHSAAELATVIKSAQRRAIVAIRRGSTELLVDLGEPD